MPSYFENEIIFMKLIFCVTDGSLPSATKLRRLCFYRCLSVHGGGGGIPARLAGGIPACIAAGLQGGVCSQGGAWSRGVYSGGCLVWGVCSWGVCSQGEVGIPACTEADPLERRLLLRTVRIPLECVLVCKNVCDMNNAKLKLW